MRTLLVQPKYYSKFPPLGLLKLSSYYKAQNHEVEYHKGCYEAPWVPNKILVTSLFTWAWKKVHDTITYYKDLYPSAEIIVGGIYASIHPDHAAKSGAKVHVGLFEEAENYLPDYSLVPEWDASIVFSSRGCINDCPFCAVPMLEPEFICKKSIKDLINPDFKKIIFWDNNFLASPYWKDIMNEVKDRNLWVDFNQGIDLRLITQEKAEMLKSLKMYLIRVAFDTIDELNEIERGIKNLIEAGIRPKKILSYLLYNYNDTPADFLFRLKKCMEWGIASYPMRFQPIFTEYSFKKDSFISPFWNEDLLEMVADARRVMGSHGAFPPYEGLKQKFLKADDLFGAMVLRPKKV